MEGLLEPTLKERVLGRAEVRQVFMIQKVGAVAGCYVTDGTIVRAGASVRVVRDGVVVPHKQIGRAHRCTADAATLQMPSYASQINDDAIPHNQIGRAHVCTPVTA